MFGDIGKMIKQAKELQDNMAQMQQDLEAVQITGEAGAGMVTVQLNGKGAMTGVKMDQSLMGDDVEVLEDLIIAAHNDAKAKLEAELATKMQGMTQGMQLPPGMFPGT